jgi:hypothetical protein
MSLKDRVVSGLLAIVEKIIESELKKVPENETRLNVFNTGIEINIEKGKKVLFKFANKILQNERSNLKRRK